MAKPRKRPKVNRSIPAATSQIDLLTHRLDLPDTCHVYAVDLFKRATTSGFLVGRKVTHCVAAVVLIACRKHDLGVTLADMVKTTGLTKHEVFQTYRSMSETFEANLPLQNPDKFIDIIGDKLNTTKATIEDAHELIRLVEPAHTAGKDPVSVAAGILYLSYIRTGEVILRRDLARAAGVAESTLSNRCGELLKAIKK